MVASRDKGRLVAKLLLYLPNFFCLARRIIAVEESVMIKKKKKGSLWSVEFEEMRGCFAHMPWVRSLHDYPSLTWGKWGWTALCTPALAGACNCSSRTPQGAVPNMQASGLGTELGSNWPAP